MPRVATLHEMTTAIANAVKAEELFHMMNDFADRDDSEPVEWLQEQATAGFTGDMFKVFEMCPGSKEAHAAQAAYIAEHLGFYDDWHFINVTPHQRAA
jgi:hypothetical protein